MQKKKQQTVKINESIKADKVRVIGSDETPLGVLSLKDAIKKAQEERLDLVLVTEKADPPVCRITDYGKYLYNQKKKEKQRSSGSKESKTKSTQIKPGTGKGELELRARKVGEWLEQGHRVNIDLFLWGRYKYMEEEFLKKRLQSFLEYITHPYEIAKEIQKSNKGFSVIVQRAKGAQKQNENKQNNKKEGEKN